MIHRDKWTGAWLRPGKPDKCQGNGRHAKFECCCDACAYYLSCFPEHDYTNTKSVKDAIK